jgi:protease I
MGSHSLTDRYSPIPDVLNESLIGVDVDLPDFGDPNPEMLKGYRVALITTHGPELPEFDVPLSYLTERGAVVDVVTQDWLFDNQPQAPGTVVLVQWLAVNVCAQANKKVSDATVEDYDALIIIGGAWNPIMLRTDDTILEFIREARNRELLIASICHGPQVLISANVFPSGTQATGVDDIRIDMSHAGFDVSDRPVVYDEAQRLITSPNPQTLHEFCEEIGSRLLEESPMQSPENALQQL